MTNPWRWHVAYNVTHKRYMVWSDASPAICECVVASDAERIARLLNADDKRQGRAGWVSA